MLPFRKKQRFQSKTIYRCGCYERWPEDGQTVDDLARGRCTPALYSWVVCVLMRRTIFSGAGAASMRLRVVVEAELCGKKGRKNSCIFNKTLSEWFRSICCSLCCSLAKWVVRRWHYVIRHFASAAVFPIITRRPATRDHWRQPSVCAKRAIGQQPKSFPISDHILRCVCFFWFPAPTFCRRFVSFVILQAIKSAGVSIRTSRLGSRSIFS